MWKYAEWRVHDVAVEEGERIATGLYVGLVTINADSSFRAEEFSIRMLQNRRVVSTGKATVLGDSLLLFSDVGDRRYRIERFVADDRLELERVGIIADVDGIARERVTLRRSPPLGDRSGRIVFVRPRELNRGSDLWILDVASGTSRRLTNDAAAKGDPAWSPDGTRIAFHSDVDGSTAVFVMIIDGAAAVRIDPGFPGSSPTWSSDGLQIAVRRTDGLYIASASGEPGSTRIGWPPSERGDVWTWPAWSPVDASILVVQGVPGSSSSEVYRVPLAGGAPTLVTRDAVSYGGSAAVYGQVDWHPSGQEFAFTASGQTRAVWRHTLAGGAPTSLTPDAMRASVPSWSPEGDAIAFTSHGDIYIATLTGTLVNLTPDSGGNFDPDWGP
jgi:dipeptidyl aminopeptidase/acylaminoacyl peptidase